MKRGLINSIPYSQSPFPEETQSRFARGRVRRVHCATWTDGIFDVPCVGGVGRQILSVSGLRPQDLRCDEKGESDRQGKGVDRMVMMVEEEGFGGEVLISAD